MTIGDYIVSISTLSTGTMMEHVCNISGSGYTVQGILSGEVRKTTILKGSLQKITPIGSELRKKTILSGQLQSITPLEGEVSKINNLKGDIKCQQ